MHIASSASGSARPLRLGEILLAHWQIKFLSTTIGLSVFFVAYFWVLKHPFFPVTLMPWMALDSWIGFHPWSFPLYVSLWVYIVIAPGVLVDKRELWFYYRGVVALAVIGLAIFILWPTATPAPDIDWNRYAGIAFLKRIDSSSNACPSLHAAFAVFSGLWNLRMLRRVGDRGVLRVLSTLWCVAILYSTLATKQHVVVDLLGGVALGTLVALVHMQLWRHRDFAACIGREPKALRLKPVLAREDMD